MSEDIERELPEGARVRVPDHVVHRAFEAETVLLNLETGTYHGLNPTGGRMLEVLQESGSLEVTIATVAAEYGQPDDAVRRDLARLVWDLEARGLLVVDDEDD